MINLLLRDFNHASKLALRNRRVVTARMRKSKPEIELGPKDSARLGEAVTRAMMELAVRGAKIYQRAGKLMRPITEPSFDGTEQSGQG